jgi:hypothetical protein
MVKIYTIVKDEVDIIKDWLTYHGSMFGWNNIYVIDNYSTDGTYEVLQEFKQLGISVFREQDYRKKGEYMTNLIRKYSSGDDKLAFPIDIDEFIVFYDKNFSPNKVLIDKTLINNYLNTLPFSKVYKANYLSPILNVKDCSRVTTELDYSRYCDMGDLAKSFFNTKYFTGELDHGNHLNCRDYHLTKIVLVHYHCRNLEQIKKKIVNNVKGLGYDLDKKNLINCLKNNSTCAGNHHIKSLLEIYENKFIMPYEFDIEETKNISITPLKNRIKEGFF